MLYELVKDSKNNGESIKRIIDLFEPKVKKCLTYTSMHERENLEQELKLKMIVCIKKYDVNSTPGFFEMMDKLK